MQPLEDVIRVIWQIFPLLQAFQYGLYQRVSWSLVLPRTPPVYYRGTVSNFSGTSVSLWNYWKSSTLETSKVTADSQFCHLEFKHANLLSKALFRPCR